MSFPREFELRLPRHEVQEVDTVIAVYCRVYYDACHVVSFPREFELCLPRHEVQELDTVIAVYCRVYYDAYIMLCHFPGSLNCACRVTRSRRWTLL